MENSPMIETQKRRSMHALGTSIAVITGLTAAFTITNIDATYIEGQTPLSDQGRFGGDVNDDLGGRA